MALVSVSSIISANQQRSLYANWIYRDEAASEWRGSATVNADFTQRRLNLNGETERRDYV